MLKLKILKGGSTGSSMVPSSIPASHCPGFAHGCEDPGGCRTSLGTALSHLSTWFELPGGHDGRHPRLVLLHPGTGADITASARDPAKLNHILAPTLQSPEDALSPVVPPPPEISIYPQSDHLLWHLPPQSSCGHEVRPKQLASSSARDSAAHSLPGGGGRTSI